MNHVISRQPVTAKVRRDPRPVQLLITVDKAIDTGISLSMSTSMLHRQYYCMIATHSFIH
jgi:hypothetical protein